MATNNKDEVIIQDEKSYNKEIKSVPKPEVGIGIDTKDVFFDNIIAQGIASSIDITKINAFSQTAQSREEVYQMLDTMCDDSLLSAVLETFAADATETNDYGQIIWCESADANVSAMVNFLLDTMRVDKHMYKWVYQLCKYGDLYLRLYRQSELKDHIFDSDEIDMALTLVMYMVDGDKQKYQRNCNKVSNKSKEKLDTIKKKIGKV